MKRLVRLLVLIAILVLALAVPATPAENENIQPPCADIIRGSTRYFARDGDRILEIRFTLAAPSCPNVIYSIIVFEDFLHQNIVYHEARFGDGSTRFEFIIRNPDDDDRVCTFATTRLVDQSTVLDRAPDTDCASDQIGTSTGPRGFN